MSFQIYSLWSPSLCAVFTTSSVLSPWFIICGGKMFRFGSVYAHSLAREHETCMAAYCWCLHLVRLLRPSLGQQAGETAKCQRNTLIFIHFQHNKLSSFVAIQLSDQSDTANVRLRSWWRRRNELFFLKRDAVKRSMKTVQYSVASKSQCVKLSNTALFVRQSR